MMENIIKEVVNKGENNFEDYDLRYFKIMVNNYRRVFKDGLEEINIFIDTDSLIT